MTTGSNEKCQCGKSLIWECGQWQCKFKPPELSGAENWYAIYRHKVETEHWLRRELAERDRIEWILTRRAMADDKPILGICRGHQMIAVAHGGSLYQDMSCEANVRHGGSHRLENIQHPLKRWLPTANVNSLHHQAVKAAPPGFKVMATANGMIESIWKPGVLGVQWHPELLLSGNRAWGDLFVWLIEGRLTA